METIALIASFTGVFIAGANLMIFCVIKFNDLKHQEESLKRIEKSVSEIWSKVDNTAERVAKLEGVCSVALKRASNKK